MKRADRRALVQAIATISLLVLIPASSNAKAGGVGTQRKVGIGFIVGEPTGLSGKYWLTSDTAVDFGAAWSFTDDGSFHLHIDYLMHDFGIFKMDVGRMALYYGIGGRVKFADESRLGIRGPIGLDYLFADAPVDAFVELGPVLDLAPETEFTLTGGIGIRFFFGPAWQ